MTTSSTLNISRSGPKVLNMLTLGILCLLNQPNSTHVGDSLIDEYSAVGSDIQVGISESQDTAQKER